MSRIGKAATVQSGLSVLTLLPEGVAGKTMPCRNRFEASGLADFEKVAAPGNEAEKNFGFIGQSASLPRRLRLSFSSRCWKGAVVRCMVRRRAWHLFAAQ